MTTIHELLDEYRELAPDERRKGLYFERLVKRYLEEEPLHQAEFDQVWLWSEWPGRDGKTDTGIDLVARRTIGGSFCAIQAKFYDPERYLQKGDIDSFISASNKAQFTDRILVSTTDRWSKNATDTLDGLTPPIRRIGLTHLAESVIDWSTYRLTDPDSAEVRPRKELREHQIEALNDVLTGFDEHDRGQLIMACGTGKTLTSLRIAERVAARGGSVLFLVPSIALLAQTLREWTQQSNERLRSFAICSDGNVGRNAEDLRIRDLEIPATTTASALKAQLDATSSSGAMTVFFSTYQSIGVVHDAQKTIGDFDLVICDEAHRTTGVIEAGDDRSAFVRVHDPEYIRGDKRLYMTATPRLYADAAKKKASEGSVAVASMDDEATFGPEFHHLKFGAAVEGGLLTDYKVLVLAVSEEAVNESFQKQFAANGSDLTISDAARVAGIYKAFSKTAVEGLEDSSREPMRRAVAFAENIAFSKRVTEMLDDNAALSKAVPRREADLIMHSRHVDGTMDILQRGEALDWLKGDLKGSNETRILTNARCLSEGVDVPALDAVVFLNPRRSIVDVVQSVGRVMRRAPGKDYGYVIIPVAIPAGVEPDQALDSNDRFQVVWQVLQALRAHDERLEAVIEGIRLNPTGEKNPQVQVVAIDRFTPSVESDTASGAASQSKLDFTPLGPEWTDAIYAKLVRKVGQREYWENWARSVAGIASRQRLRLEGLLETRAEIRAEFARFVKGLRANLNESITETDALDMLAQHIITEPVLEILFDDFDFAASNPVAAAMNRMLDALDSSNVTSERGELADFYAGVKRSVGQITDAQGKQRFLKQLYERFFRIAMSKAAERLGIVYTPNEIVDFILRSVDELSREHFGKGLADEGVHILDPFTGTGTFLAQLILNDELMPGHALPHKFRNELWANEINLLAYYVAAANLEQAYRSRMGGNYVAFPHIALTDTFQNTEDGDALDAEGVFASNNDVVIAENAAPISIIIGNPPYSRGQASGNDDNKNAAYPTLDGRIRTTYAAESTSTNKNALYDAYVRSLRWASDRIGERGIVAFVTNGAFIDTNTGEGIRRSLAREFDTVQIYNLRGNTRNSGETARREGGQTFGSGSRATIVIVLLVKGTHALASSGVLIYSVPDYQSRDEKLRALATWTRLADIPWREVDSRHVVDWLSSRSDAYAELTPATSKTPADSRFFENSALGVATNRDPWVWGFSRGEVEGHVRRHVEHFNGWALRRAEGDTSDLEIDEKSAKWTRGLRQRLKNGRAITFNSAHVTVGQYRPFTREMLYLSSALTEAPGGNGVRFGDGRPNVVLVATTPNSGVDFYCLATDVVPDLHFVNSGQGFPRFTYERRHSDANQLDLGDSDPSEEYTRVDNVTDGILTDYRATYTDASITKDDVFFYVYGVLHSPEYRERFAADLKKMLPRIPKTAEFWAFSNAGKKLSELHLGYETIDPWPLEERITGAPTDEQLLHVTKMRFVSKADKSSVVVNEHLTLAGIPPEAHEYLLGSRSALEWILERYQIKTDKASGIVNDPNAWGAEHGDPRYIVDLVKRITRVSVETVAIVSALPKLGIRGVDDVAPDDSEIEVDA